MSQRCKMRPRTSSGSTAESQIIGNLVPIAVLGGCPTRWPVSAWQDSRDSGRNPCNLTARRDDPALRLGDDQRRLLELVLGFFPANLAWPTYRWLNQLLYVEYKLGLDELFAGMPAGLLLPEAGSRGGAAPRPDGEVWTSPALEDTY
jgi:hypothetical protein